MGMARWGSNGIRYKFRFLSLLSLFPLRFCPLTGPKQWFKPQPQLHDISNT